MVVPLVLPASRAEPRNNLRTPRVISSMVYLMKRTRSEFVGERRWQRRFPIQLAIRYKPLNSRLSLHRMGTTIDFSSKGIAFATEDILPVGRQVEISVDWPAKIDGHCSLRFVAVGRVVRSGNDRVAVLIYHHEFKTRGQR